MKRLLTSLLTCILAAAAQGQTLLINEIYHGGGAGTGSPAYRTDYIEIYNAGSTPIDLAGFRLDYGSSAQAAGTFPTAVGVLTASLLTGSSVLQPGQYFLIRTGSSGAAGATDVPADNVFATGASLSATSGAIRLQDAVAVILDIVGWGTTNNFEGQAALAATSTAVSISRTNFVDTNNNRNDFSSGTATPTSMAPIPEPTVLFASLAGLAGMLVLRRKR